MQLLNTEKLFYRKWLYKVICNSPYIPYTNARQRRDFRTEIEDIVLANGGKLYFSYHSFVVLCNDEQTFEKYLEIFKNKVRKGYKPASEAHKKFLLDNQNKRRLIKKSEYKYRVHISLQGISYDEISGLKTWEETYEDLLKFSPTFKRVIASATPTNSFWRTVVMHSKTDQGLTLINMKFGHSVKKIEELVPPNAV